MKQQVASRFVGQARPGVRLLPAHAVLAAGLLVGACGSDPPPAPKRASHVSRPVAAASTSTAPAGTPASPRRAESRADDPAERERRDAKAAQIAAGLGLQASDIAWSSKRRTFALAVPAKTEEAAAKILLLGSTDGEKLAEFEALRPGPVTELKFLDDLRLLYVAAPAPRPKAKGAKPTAPKITYVVQSITPGSPPLACEGTRFVWSQKGNHLAWVGGEPGAEYVGADGQKVYPRNGVTTIVGEPAWSRDGHSLAFVELAGKPGSKPGKGGQPKLIVLAEFDNPTGDLSWDLPVTIDRNAMRVFWAGRTSIVVGESLTKPAYSSSFERE